MDSPNKRSATRTEIEACIDQRAFRMEYQPIVHLDTGTVAGVEALCRFTDRTATERRFRQSERLGLAPNLDLAIVEAVLVDVPHTPGDFVSINLSPSTLLDERLVDALLSPEVPADRIVIEVTEHARIPDYERAQRLLAAVRASGIRLAVDDAGAGYATFRHILALRPDVIKMDRSITHDIDADTARRALATALVIFAGELGATVVAEGVETDAEVLALRRAGVHRGQGYVLARPQPLPLKAPAYRPVPLDELLDIPAPPPAAPGEDAATEAVTAHRLLASVDAITGVLDILGARLGAIGEDRYRGLIGTAQRQIQHVEGALRAMVRGLQLDASNSMSEPLARGTGRGRRSGALRRAGRSSTGPEATSTSTQDARSRALRRLRATVEAASVAQAEIEDVVALGRQVGVTWDEIAEVLGVTRQGAQKRYGQGRLA